MWANVGKSLNCIIAMVDRLLEKDNMPSITTENGNDPLPAERVAPHLSGRKHIFIIIEELNKMKRPQESERRRVGR